MPGYVRTPSQLLTPEIVAQFKELKGVCRRGDCMKLAGHLDACGPVQFWAVRHNAITRAGARFVQLSVFVNRDPRVAQLADQRDWYEFGGAR